MVALNLYVILCMLVIFLHVQLLYSLKINKTIPILIRIGRTSILLGR